MDNKTALTVALSNINSTVELLKDNSSFSIINSQLTSVRLILESQLVKEANVDITPDAPVTPLPNVDTTVSALESEDYDIPKQSQSQQRVNTYRVELDSTQGWQTAEVNKSERMTREAASQYMQELMATEGYAPYRLRVVVDGQV
tara:strand:+ start:659 stop:1093 length:435 start_codon:yes stop_codon:yes gene_type:complete